MDVPHARWAEGNGPAAPDITPAAPVTDGAVRPKRVFQRRLQALPTQMPMVMHFCPGCGMDLQSINAAVYLRQLQLAQQTATSA